MRSLAGTDLMVKADTEEDMRKKVHETLVMAYGPDVQYKLVVNGKDVYVDVYVPKAVVC